MDLLILLICNEKIYFIVLFLCLFLATVAQKHYNFKLSRVNYFEDSTRVGISFKIKNAKDFDRFDLDVSAFDEKQNLLVNFRII